MNTINRIKKEVSNNESIMPSHRDKIQNVLELIEAIHSNNSSFNDRSIIDFDMRLKTNDKNNTLYILIDFTGNPNKITLYVTFYIQGDKIYVGINNPSSEDAVEIDFKEDNTEKISYTKSLLILIHEIEESLEYSKEG